MKPIRCARGPRSCGKLYRQTWQLCCTRHTKHIFVLEMHLKAMNIRQKGLVGVARRVDAVIPTQRCQGTKAVPSLSIARYERYDSDVEVETHAMWYEQRSPHTLLYMSVAVQKWDAMHLALAPTVPDTS